MAHWHNCPSLAAFWCNGIFVLFYLYTIYVASTRYNQFKLNSGNPKYGFNWEENYIVFYLISILTASLFWLIFLYASLFRTGNLANDYVELGKIVPIPDDSLTSTKCFAVIAKIFKRIRYHFIPFNAIIHLIGAFFLFIPLPLLIEEENRHGIFHYGENNSSYMLLCIYIPEITNFLLAAFSITVRLPTVFSSASRSFGIIFSFLVFVATGNIFIHCITNQLILSYISKLNWRLCLSNVIIFCISSINFCLIYEHGRTRFLESISNRKIDCQDQISSKSGISQSGRSFIERYWPNISALSLWIALVALYLDQYCRHLFYNALYLFDVCISITYCLVWLVVWLLFTFKSDWEFSNVRSDIKIVGPSREPSFRIQQMKPTDTIYTCFQNADPIRSTSSQSSKTPNQEISSNSSSSSSRMSEKVALQNCIPSISKRLDFPDCNYDDIMNFKSTHRSTKNHLKEISEENPDYQVMFQPRSEVSPTDLEFFKSPNISQRSSNIHSSDSGIGINPDYIFTNKIPDSDTLKYRSFSQQGLFLSKAHEYNNIDEELLDHCEITNTNMCSDV